MVAIRKTQLLATKILPPQCRAGLVERPRLLDLIGNAQTKQVALVKAGPGFGKTTLAVAFAEQLQRSGRLVAWLALDDEDDEPARFLFMSRTRCGAASLASAMRPSI